MATVIMIILGILIGIWLNRFPMNTRDKSEIKHIGDPKYTYVNTDKLLKCLQTGGDLSELDKIDIYDISATPVITDICLLVEKLIETVAPIARESGYDGKFTRDTIVDIVQNIYPDPLLGLDKSDKMNGRELIETIIESIIIQKKYEHRPDNFEYNNATNTAFLDLVRHVDKSIEPIGLELEKPKGVSLIKDDIPNKGERPVTFDELERRLTQYIPGEYTTQNEDNIKGD